jgi:ABC-type multidrug transport system fused ATPase/permease subunit
MRKKWSRSTIGRSMSVLTRSDQRKVLIVIGLQISLSVLDLIGVAIVGLVGALSITGIQSQKPGNRVSSVLEVLRLSDNGLQYQVAILGIAAGLFFVTRSLLSIFISRRTLYFLSRRGAFVSSRLVFKLLSNSLLEVQKLGIQQTVYALTSGVNTITLGVLGTAIALISDGALLIVMTMGLFVVDPLIAASMMMAFTLIAFALYRLFNKKIQKLGVKDSTLAIRTNERIVEVLTTYRESIVRNRRQFYAEEIGNLRMEQSEAQAEMAFMPSINKYVIETAVVLIALAIGATQFALRDAAHAIATLSIFLAAGSRIAPAVLRLQQGFLSIRGSLGAATPTLNLIENLFATDEISESGDEVDVIHKGFVPSVEVSNISLKYPNKDVYALKDVSFKINPGEFVAIVGISGAGKTSIVDVILGVINPTSGSVSISGIHPREAFKRWAGAVGYVPQNVEIVNASIRDNIILGYTHKEKYNQMIASAIQFAQLSDVIAKLPQLENTQVGERGAELSGGQRQRLGIARALFTSPKLLVLDEATSALDGETESRISEAISQIKGTMTLIVIAHRLSTIRNADKILYFHEGKLSAVGNFEELRVSVPDFDKQANLMGL